MAFGLPSVSFLLRIFLFLSVLIFFLLNYSFSFGLAIFFLVILVNFPPPEFFMTFSPNYCVGEPPCLNMRDFFTDDFLSEVPPPFIPEIPLVLGVPPFQFPEFGRKVPSVKRLLRLSFPWPAPRNPRLSC